MYEDWPDAALIPVLAVLWLLQTLLRYVSEALYASGTSEEWRAVVSTPHRLTQKVALHDELPEEEVKPRLDP